MLRNINFYVVDPCLLTFSYVIFCKYMVITYTFLIARTLEKSWNFKHLYISFKVIM